MRGHLADVINRAKFLSQSDQGFWFCGESNFWLSHRKEKLSLTHGLNYRSACDLTMNDVTAAADDNDDSDNIWWLAACWTRGRAVARI